MVTANQQLKSMIFVKISLCKVRSDVSDILTFLLDSILTISNHMQVHLELGLELGLKSEFGFRLGLVF